MTRDEWYESNNFKLLRLLNHYAADFGQKLQEMADIMELVAALRPDCVVHDKTIIFQQQMRIMGMDVKALWAAETNWEELFEPKWGEDQTGNPIAKEDWEKGDDGYWRRKFKEDNFHKEIEK